jgi:hypothetical protein
MEQMLNLDDRVDFSDPNTLDLINGWIEDKPGMNLN